MNIKSLISVDVDLSPTLDDAFEALYRSLLCKWLLEL